eukprot:CAMPEP_0204215448 /NCGR_PEP_ID=MMETSP0361-20130328/77453_1 /ASSEMBLY_ACC=CAM_ASM_000343 /TAXON_ID=268821 /ORGANISM="Scrippsiella Hangoei, Strain SHTV-5" /LENGTH=274 /DNA_ID=CAMNT_0051180193 /DNA_START=33 /DNA_END=857 /DNA_ORIENTATION=+
MSPGSAPCLLLLALIGGYAAYSWMVYMRLRPTFLQMQWAASQRPEGTEEEVQDALSALRQSGGSPVQVADVPEWSLASLLAKADADADSTHIVEDFDERLGWHSLFQQIRGQGAAADDLLGTWQFCFRDYVNEEELSAMALERGAFTPVRLRGATTLEISRPQLLGGNPSATLCDRFLLMGVLPAEIMWRGYLASDDELGNRSLIWQDTSARLGFGRFCQTIERPAAAEKLRQQPWRVEGFVDRARNAGGAGGPPVLALCRQGIGTLAFRRSLI